MVSSGPDMEIALSEQDVERAESYQRTSETYWTTDLTFVFKEINCIHRTKTFGLKVRLRR
jgi:hypothetical protein